VPKFASPFFVAFPLIISSSSMVSFSHDARKHTLHCASISAENQKTSAHNDGICQDIFKIAIFYYAHEYYIQYWLMVSTPLKNMKVSWDYSLLFPIYGKIKNCSKPPTRILYIQ